MSKFHTMSANKVEEFIVRLAKMKNPPTILIYGDPGVGKSETIERVAKRLSRHYFPLSLGRLEPGDVKGLPDVSGDNTVFKSPDFYNLAEKFSGQIIYHLDEFTLAHEDVQGAVLDFVQFKKVDNKQLHKETMIICTGNKGGKDGTYAKQLTSALTSGRMLILEMSSPGPIDVINYIVKTQGKIYKELEAFLRGSKGITNLYMTNKDKDGLSTTPRNIALLNATGLGMEIDTSTPEGAKDFLALAEMTLHPAGALDLRDVMSDSIIDGIKLIANDKAEWARYMKTGDLKRILAVNEVARILSETSYYKELAKTAKEKDVVKLKKDTVQGFVDILAKHEKRGDLVGGFCSEVCKNDCFLKEDLMVDIKDPKTGQLGRIKVGTAFDKVDLEKLAVEAGGETQGKGKK